MKHDILDKLRENLRAKYTSKNTADKYYFAVNSLFNDYNFNTVEQISPEEIQCRMLKLRTKKDFSAAKCGLVELKECFPSLSLPGTDFFEDTISHKRNYKKRTFEPLELDMVKQKINTIPDKRLKVAYRLMHKTGARVSEVAALRPGNIKIDDESIHIEIINGKGGKYRVVKAIDDDYLKQELPEVVTSSEQDKPVFYSASHMKNKAGELGIECHDLRRAFAQEYRDQCRQTMNAYDANGKVMEAMGHTRFRTTRRYLNRKIIKDGEPTDKRN